MTPHMVGLAERLEDAEFHLVLSHSQDISSREEVVAYLGHNKLQPHALNVTVTKNGGHPALNVGAYRPYYALFDHAGRLVHQGMGSTYHGGDELGMLERAEALVKQAPAIWVGEAPFERQAALAAAVRKGRRLDSALETIEAARDEAQEDPELRRIELAIQRHVARRLQRAGRLEGLRPSAVLPLLKDLARDLKGTELGARVESRRAAAAASKELARAVALERAFVKIAKSFERVKEAKRTPDLVEKTGAKLEALLEGNADLPFAATVEAWMRRMG